MVTSFALSYRFSADFEQTIPITVFAIVFILYIFAYFSHLNTGVVIIILCISICAIYCIIIFLSPYHKTKSITRNIIILVALIGLLWWGYRDCSITSSDDFSHWARVVKNMVYFNDFGNSPDSSIQFYDYPPATSLFAYFWMKLAGSFTEENIFRANALFSFSLLLPMCSQIMHSKQKAWYEIALVIVLPTLFINMTYQKNSVDTLLGILFAFILVTYYITPENKLKWTTICLACAVLPLVKAIGLFFALLAACIIAWDMLVTQKRMKNIKNSVKQLFILLSSVALSKCSWVMYIKHLGYKVDSVASAINAEKDPEAAILAFNNFINNLFANKMYGYILPLPIFAWLLIFGFTATVIYHFVPLQQKQRIKSLLIFLFFGNVIYIIGICGLYQFIYNEEQALLCVSMERYLGIYFMGLYIVLILLLAHFSMHKMFSQRYLLPLLLICTVIITNPVNSIVRLTVSAPAEAVRSAKYREGYNKIARLQTVADKGSTVFIVNQKEENGEENRALSYCITPLRSLALYVGKDLNPNFGDGLNYTVSELGSVLVDYDYVYLYRVDEQFKSRYGNLFEQPEKIVADHFFTVEKHGDIRLAFMNL